MAKETLSVSFVVRMTPDERDAMHEKAAAEHMPAAAYVRKLIREAPNAG